MFALRAINTEVFMKKIFAVVTVIAVALALCISSFAGLDAMYANVKELERYDDESPNAGFAGKVSVTINKGDKLYILGWAAKNDAVLEKIYWTVDGESKECSDVYRDREDLFTVGVVTDAEYAKHAGFGYNDDMMELIGADELAEGEYAVAIIALFDDGSEADVKPEFTLYVGGQQGQETKENDLPRKLAVELVPDSTQNGVEITEEDDGSLLCETIEENADPWISLVLDEIDTSIYTSFTVTYEITGELHGNNVYLRDLEVNPGYSPNVGTWTPPKMQGKTERTFEIEDEFGLMVGTELTGVRFPGAKTGGSIRITSIVFNNPNGVNVRDFDSDEGDALSFDQILANDAEIANGNDAIIATKKAIDGTNGDITSITMFGWYGNANSETVAFGYKIDDADIVYGEFFADTEDAVTQLNANNRRFKVTVPVSELKDDAHTIWVYAKLANGDIVKLNRFDNRGEEGEKDREVYVVFNGPATPTEAPTEEPTATPDAETPTEAPADATEAPATTEEPKKSGCGSVALGGAAVIALAAAALIIRKKH